MGKHIECNRKMRLLRAARMIEPIAKTMMDEGRGDAFQTRDRKLYLKYHDGVALTNAVMLLERLARQ